MLAKILICLFLCTSIGCLSIKCEEFKISPVGLVKKQEKVTTIEIDNKYKDALIGLDEFSHVLVCYWLHKNDIPEKRQILQVHPRGDHANALTGVFATRSPQRPNLIAISLCKILSVKGNTIQIDTIDAFDGSPVIDLKPYMPSIDSVMDAQVPAWVGK